MLLSDLTSFTVEVSKLHSFTPHETHNTLLPSSGEGTGIPLPQSTSFPL